MKAIRVSRNPACSWLRKAIKVSRKPACFMEGRGEGGARSVPHVGPPQGEQCNIQGLEQELPAIKSTVRGITGQNAQSKVAWRRLIQERLQMQRLKAEAARLQDKKKSGRLQRVGAYHFGRGLDNALYLLGSGLSVFSKKGVCKPLKPHEKSYSIKAKQPHPFDVPPGVPTLRACVKDFQTGQKKIRVNLGPNIRPSSSCWRSRRRSQRSAVVGLFTELHQIRPQHGSFASEFTRLVASCAGFGEWPDDPEHNSGFQLRPRPLLDRGPVQEKQGTCGDVCAKRWGRRPFVV